MTRLVVATRNRGKLAEFRAALEPSGVAVVGLDAIDDTSDAGDLGEVEETGATFEENARLKAEAYSRATDLPVLADDSGLEIDALDGAPGVLSARYGGPGLDDAARCRLVLDALAGVPAAERTARFRCVLAIARRGRTLAVHEGSVEGVILDEPRGANGFGYDPIFYYPPLGKTFAELTPTEKHRVSHRGRALETAARKSGTATLLGAPSGDPKGTGSG